jgi:hypothetical protein
MNETFLIVIAAGQTCLPREGAHPAPADNP